MRSSLTRKVEQGKHFEISAEEFEEALKEPNRLFLGYRRVRKRHRKKEELFPDDFSEDEYRTADRAISDQNGGELHGYLVLVGLNLLVEHFDLYNSIEEASKKVEIEGGLSGQEPDILDEQNNVVIECGFINRFDERIRSFLDKSLNYAVGVTTLENFDQYTFIHLPKDSVSREQIEFDVWNYEEDGKYRVLEFKEKLDELVDEGPLDIYD